MPKLPRWVYLGEILWRGKSPFLDRDKSYKSHSLCSLEKSQNNMNLSTFHLFPNKNSFPNNNFRLSRLICPLCICNSNTSKIDYSLKISPLHFEYECIIHLISKFLNKVSSKSIAIPTKVNVFKYFQFKIPFKIKESILIL